MMLPSKRTMIFQTLSITCIILSIQSDLVSSREISDVQTNQSKKDLESCYHAEKLLRSGISPDLVIRTLEATGQVSRGFLEEILSKALHQLGRSSPQTIGKTTTSSKIPQPIRSSKQATTALTTPLLDIPNLFPLIYPESYAVIPDVKITSKYKNKDRSAINSLIDIVTTNSNLLQAFPIGVTLTGNKYRGSDVDLEIQDIQMNTASGLRSYSDQKHERNKISNRMAASGQVSGLCDDFVARGIMGRENLLDHLLTKNVAKKVSPVSERKSGQQFDREGDVIINTKAVNGKHSNIRNVQDIILGIAALDESFDILDIMSDDDFKDSKVSANDLFMVTTRTINT